MQPDDVYPNDGTFLGGVPLEPVEQAIARKKETAQTLEGLSVLKEVVERLKERIDFYGSVDAIPKEVKVKPRQFLIVHNANQLVRDVLRSEKEYIEELIDSHAKNR